MATYTVELRKQIDNLLRFQYDLHQLTHAQKIENVLPLIFNFDFDIFDEKYRSVIETKLLNAYYFRELGYETYGEWHFRLKEFLQRRMPYYNRLYRSALVNDYDPFDDVGYKDTYTRSNNSNRDTNETGAHSDHAETDMESHATDSGTTDSTSHNSDHSETDTESHTTDSGTRDGTTNKTGSKDSKDSGTENERTTAQDTPQQSLNANEHYASGITVDNKNHSNDVAETHSDDAKTHGENAGKSDTTGKNTTDSKGDDQTHGENAGKSDTTGKSTTDSKGDTGLTQNQKFQNTEQYLFERHGRTGRFNVGQLIDSQRKNILDVDTLLVSEANELFLLVYDY